MKSLLRAFVVLIVLGIVVVAAVIYSGIYPIDATTPHPAPIYHLLHYTMRRSVAQHADGISAPDLSDQARIRHGLALYGKHCLQCHGAPGVAPDPLAEGMTPAPPNLMPTAREWPSTHIYWVIRHGVKMTAMPAWQDRMSDSDMWDLVAFVRNMAELTPQQYKAMAGIAQTAGNDPPWPETGQLGDPDAGRRKMQQYLCATCHAIPGIQGADKNVGPPLAGIAERQYIGGVLRNTPANMVRWLHDPPAVDPLTAMPDLRLREQDARDIAAYLYTLR